MTGKQPPQAFEDRSAYDTDLNRSLRISGENNHYFLRGRVLDLEGQLGPDRKPRQILDYGCGTGDTTAFLAETFPEAEVIGFDTAAGAIREARSLHGSAHVHFESGAELPVGERFDLCYVNGVFHHIEPAQRVAVVRRIRSSLRPGGQFALMENNPWNPGTRIIMSRIEFDRDAIPISPPEAGRLLREGGFSNCGKPRWLFFFPRPLGFLRFLEPSLARFPLGAQYYYLVTKT
jgi:SAM-dependent methyltransferase